ncbi:MAG: branched-chain amino acid ABC transporter permease, partial [Acidimicrobiia bacterium]
PYPLALLLAALTVVPVGGALAIPAIRLSGLFLALATFSFGVLAQYLLFNMGLAFGRDAVAVIPRPDLLDGDRAFFYFVLGVVAASLFLIETVRVTRLGRITAAVADSPLAMQSVGANPIVSRVMVFCLSAFFAALAGGLLGSLVQVATTTSFDFFQSLVWVTLLVVAGARGFAGPMLAAVLLIALPAVFTSPAVTEWQPVVFGVSAILLARFPNGIAGLARLPDFARLSRGWEWRTEDRRLAERRELLGREAAR